MNLKPVLYEVRNCLQEQSSLMDRMKSQGPTSGSQRPGHGKGHEGGAERCLKDRGRKMTYHWDKEQKWVRVESEIYTWQRKAA